MADLESFDMPTDFAYLSFSKWLIVLMLATSLYASDATGSRRVAKTLGWLAVGIVLAIITCFPRLIAEYELLIAREAEQQGDFAYSRQMVESAGRACPGLANLHSVWLLIGSLDEKQGRSTVASQLWTAEKWSQNGDLPRSLAIVLGPASDSEGETSGVAKWLAGMYLTRAGLTHFSARRPASAADAWRRALSFDPERRDCALFLGIAQSQMDRERSDLVEIEFQPLMTRMSDGALRADVLNLLGDAHFLAGNVDAARDCYQKSYELFNLPKIINYRAIKGLGGF